MAKMKKEEIDKIVQRQMPGFRVASKANSRTATDATRRRPAPDSETPDLQTLRRKYVRKDTQRYSRSTANDNPPAGQDDDEIVIVEPIDATDARSRAARSKAVIVSGANKRIVGKQG